MSSYKKYLKKLFEKHNFSPKKFLGQNFLVSRGICKTIVETAEISKRDIVLEVGPGVGNLTVKLAKKAKKVIAIERDKKMIEILKDVLKNANIRNVKIVQGDILKLEPKTFDLKIYKLVANIPYYLTSRLIRKFLEEKRKPKLIVLMVQKEVAQRICAKPPKMNLLAVSVQFYASPKITSFISKKCFWPSPRVDSAIIKIVLPKSAYPISVDPPLFFKIVKAGFSQPRKQLVNNLSRKMRIEKGKVRKWLSESKVNPVDRAGMLPLEGWINLAKNYKIIEECPRH